MAGKTLSNISIANGITALVLDAIWLILQALFSFSEPTNEIETIIIVVNFICYMGAFILGLVGSIYTLIVLPFCIKERKVMWLIGFVLNLAGMIIPGISLALILFLIFCFVNPFG